MPCIANRLYLQLQFFSVNIFLKSKTRKRDETRIDNILINLINHYS